MKDELSFLRALEFARRHTTADFDAGEDVVRIGRADQLDAAAGRELDAILADFGPWRKGPFEIFGRRVDANWRCELKWNRVRAFADELRDKRVCDVGTGNGWYLFRMAHEQPRALLGLDPTLPFYQCFRFLQVLVAPALDQVRYEAQGFECLRERDTSFDSIFCMGVLYHHPEPFALLRTLRAALEPGGQLVLETLAVPANFAREPLALTPQKGRYGGAGGVWFVPNAPALEQWLLRAGFRDVVLRGEYDFRNEQVRTADLPGLCDALDPAEPSRTIEGYPVPVRLYASARR